MTQSSMGSFRNMKFPVWLEMTPLCKLVRNPNSLNGHFVCSIPPMWECSSVWLVLNIDSDLSLLRFIAVFLWRRAPTYCSPLIYFLSFSLVLILCVLASGHRLRKKSELRAIRFYVAELSALSLAGQLRFHMWKCWIIKTILLIILLLILLHEHYNPLWTLASNTIFLHSWRSLSELLKDLKIFKMSDNIPILRSSVRGSMLLLCIKQSCDSRMCDVKNN
jgi:hypothetical protein